MTPSENNLPFSYWICKNRLHRVSNDLKRCPQCAEISGRRNYLKNKEQQIARASSKYYANHEEEKHKAREEYRLRLEKNPNYCKEQYQKNREKRLDWMLAYNRANRELGVWKSMINRCTSPINKSYPDYGGRGIKVCDRWLGENGYHNFLADMGKRPSDGHQLDRINNNGNYEPSNCQWKTRSEQCRNRRNNFLITWNGETRCLQEWSEKTGISYRVIRDRIKKLGWSPDKALTTSADGRTREVQIKKCNWSRRREGDASCMHSFTVRIARSKAVPKRLHLECTQCGRRECHLDQPTEKHVDMVFYGPLTISAPKIMVD